MQPGLAACGDSETAGGDANATPERGGTLRVGVVGSGTDGLDAHVSNTEAGNLYANALHDGLTQFDHRLRPQLALAEELEPTADARSWTVRLRDGVTFHDGKPVTADDVIFSLRRIIDPEVGANAALGLAAVDPNGLRDEWLDVVVLVLLLPGERPWRLSSPLAAAAP